MDAFLSCVPIQLLELLLPCFGACMLGLLGHIGIASLGLVREESELVTQRIHPPSCCFRSQSPSMTNGKFAFHILQE